MSRLKSLPALCLEPEGWIGSAARRLLAWWLEAASAALSRLAACLVDRSAATSSVDARFEFTDLGEGSGALFVDGELVGWVRGVQRL